VEVVGLVVTGALAGWIAALLVRGAGFGLVINIVIGVVGGVLGGAILSLLGVLGVLGVLGLGGWAEHGGWLLSLTMAVAGAVLLLTVLNLLRRRE
jgi:uncharacterized membrane protein YeaQ/YmgE (transglycosylase-associated protein family)